MIPIIDKKKTGVHLRRIMDERGLSVKDVQQYLGLGSVQSVYHWLNGKLYYKHRNVLKPMKQVKVLN